MHDKILTIKTDSKVKAVVYKNRRGLTYKRYVKFECPDCKKNRWLLVGMIGKVSVPYCTGNIIQTYGDSPTTA